MKKSITENETDGIAWLISVSDDIQDFKSQHNMPAEPSKLSIVPGIIRSPEALEII